MLRSLLFVTMFVCGARAPQTNISQVTPSDSLPTFPSVEGTNLEGRRFSLPNDFESEYNVVLVAFRREQQLDVDSWLPFLREQQLAERGVRMYELPTLKRMYRLVRGFIDGGMAGGIPDLGTRQATITLYIDKAPFKKALAIETEDAISLLIVARDGRVLWQASGPFARNVAADLAAALDSVVAPALSGVNTAY